MKHLKRFNEELNPATYISAGTKLKYRGHEERGKSLIDHGTSKLPKLEEYTFFIKRNSNVTKTTGKWDYSKKEFVCVGTKLYACARGLKSYGGNVSGSGYVKTRKEALEIFNLIKSTSPELITSLPADDERERKLTVNDLYRDDIEELYNKSQEEESSSKSKEEMLKGITSPNDKPKNFYHKHIKPFFEPFFQSDDVDKSIPSKGIPPKA